MGISDQQTSQKFPFPYDNVYEGLIKIIPKLGLEIKFHDKLLGRISASSGLSLFSYGENITIIVEKMDEQSTMIKLESSLKVGFNIAGTHRHQKNFDSIISALSKHLQEEK